MPLPVLFHYRYFFIRSTRNIRVPSFLYIYYKPDKRFLSIFPMLVNSRKNILNVTDNDITFFDIHEGNELSFFGFVICMANTHILYAANILTRSRQSERLILVFHPVHHLP